MSKESRKTRKEKKSLNGRSKEKISLSLTSCCFCGHVESTIVDATLPWIHILSYITSISRQLMRENFENRMPSFLEGDLKTLR